MANLKIDPELLERAFAVSGERTKTATVTRALEELIAKRNTQKLRELFGKVDWDPNYDYKAERSRDKKVERLFSGEDPR